MKGVKARWYAKNAAKAVAYSGEWRRANEAHCRALRKAEYARDAEMAKQLARDYRKANGQKVAAWSRAAQCAKLKRTPKWLTSDDYWLIEQAYELAKLRTERFGFAWHVDHIIPLRGKLVSGLHVPHNLQVVPACENQSKSNRYTVA
jgi:hypothetical protein